MRSIRIIILGIAVAVVSIAVEAQQKTLLQTEVMAKQLDLDAKQKAELDKFFKGIKSEREAKQVKMKALKEEMLRDQFVERQDQEAKLKTILTEEQFAKVQEQRKNGMKRQMLNRQKSGENGKRNFQNNGQMRQRADVERGQRGQQRQMRQEGARNEMARDPEMRKKFQEFLELEKQKKEKNGGGN